VFIDTPSSELPTDTIDDVAGREMATRHLISLSHTQIGFIGDDDGTAIGAPASADRRRGYMRAMRASELTIHNEFIGLGPHGTDPARVSAETMLSRPRRPSAIFAASDVQALGVLAAARILGITVPKGLSVIGFDDISLAEFIGLTTIRQPLYLSGRRAAIRLLELLGHGSGSLPDLPESPPLELIARHTTAAAAATPNRSLALPDNEGRDLVTTVANALDPAARQDQPVPRRK
jgi:LacI family transcriptional regulator